VARKNSKTKRNIARRLLQRGTDKIDETPKTGEVEANGDGEMQSLLLKAPPTHT
jgi:hypothetical protein